MSVWKINDLPISYPACEPAAQAVIIMKVAEFLALVIPTLVISIVIGWPMGLLVFAVITHGLPIGKANPRDNCQTIVRRTLMTLACIIAAWGALIIAASPWGAIECLLVALALFAVSHAVDYLFAHFRDTGR